jgi:hypothetical protein
LRLSSPNSVVVLAAQERIPQNGIGTLDLFEALLRVRVTANIRMELGG